MPGAHGARPALVRDPVERYWDFDFHEPEERDGEDAYVDRLDELFRQAVERQLVADVPWGPT